MGQADGLSKSGKAPGGYLAACFSDADQLSEAMQAWDLSLLQLDAGPMRADLAEIRFGATALMACSLGRGFRQAGGSPPGCRTIGIPLEGCTPFRWHGHQVGSGVIMIFPKGGELASRSQAGFQVITLTVPDVLIEQRAETLDSGWTPGAGAHVVRPPAQLLRAVRARATRLLGVARESPGALEAPGFLEEIEFDLLNQALGALAFGMEQRPRPMAAERSRVLRQARDLIEDRVSEPLQISELVSLTGSSPRTLRYAFEEEFGVSPKVYLKSRRLLELRRRLLRADSRMTVSEIALDLGFGHMGQLSADYRSMYDELPSVTLQAGI